MTKNELLSNTKDLYNSSAMLKDLLQGDNEVLKKLEDMHLDMDAIKTAVTFLTNNIEDEKERSKLITESWRINFKAKPPTPEEFITPTYIGPAAEHTWPWIKKTFIDFLDPSKPYRNLILYPHIGWGKLLAYGEIVYTPNGFKKIDDIKEGDVVCTPCGSTSNVINVSDFPNEDIYKIRTKDKRVSYVGGNHYWKAAHSFSVRKGKRVPNWKIITTEKLLEDIKYNPKHRWFIPLTKPIYFEKKTHIISPYALGVLLGDGHFGKQVIITNNDLDIFKHCTFSNSIFSDKSNDNKYSSKYRLCLRKSEETEEIKRLGLHNTRSNTKFIPKEYLYDSIENRIELLQGLMDTDGCCNKSKKGTVTSSYWTTSEQLANDFEVLVRSLGGITHKNIRVRDDKINYTINLSFPTYDFDIFKLERKKSIYKEGFNYRNKSRRQYVYIKDIVKTDRQGGKCIETDDEERLFLTNDFLVTHNSYLSTLTTLYISTCINMMRNPWRYFNLNPATQLSQLLVSYSLKKSSELLLEPYIALLESSPFFERCQRMEQMKEAEEAHAHSETIDKLYWTTAYKTSALGFSSGSTIKIASSPNGLLGLSIISIVFSELAFFTDAGKALQENELIRMFDHSSKQIKDLVVGDKISHPTLGYTEVEKIMWEGEDIVYEITVDDGRTVKCNAKHLWPVEFDKDGEHFDTVVTTQYMIDNSDIDFYMKSI